MPTCDVTRSVPIALAAISAGTVFEMTEKAVHGGLLERVSIGVLAAIPAGAIGAILVPLAMLIGFYVVPWTYRRVMHPDLPRGVAPWRVISLLRELRTDDASFDRPPVSPA
jgi:hypothetical protein